MSIGETPASIDLTEKETQDFVFQAPHNSQPIHDWVEQIPDRTGVEKANAETARLTALIADAVQGADELLRNSNRSLPAMVISRIQQFDIKHGSYTDLKIDHGMTRPNTGLIPNIVRRRTGRLGAVVNQHLVEIPLIDTTPRSVVAPTWNSHVVNSDGIETILSGYGKKTIKRPAEVSDIPAADSLALPLPGGSLREAREPRNPFNLQPGEDGYRRYIPPQPLVRYDGSTGVRESLPTPVNYQTIGQTVAVIGNRAIKMALHEIYKDNIENYELPPRVSRELIIDALKGLRVAVREKNITGKLSRKQKKHSPV